jgi:hypothetical protein
MENFPPHITDTRPEESYRVSLYVWSQKPRKGPYVPVGNLQEKRCIGIGMPQQSHCQPLTPEVLDNTLKQLYQGHILRLPFKSTVCYDGSHIARSSCNITKCCEILSNVRFQVLTAASMKVRVLWDVAPCSRVEVDRCFIGAYCFHHQGYLFIAPMMEAVHTSETSVNFNVTPRRYIPEDSNLQVLSLQPVMAWHAVLSRKEWAWTVV